MTKLHITGVHIYVLKIKPIKNQVKPPQIGLSTFLRATKVIKGIRAIRVQQVRQVLKVKQVLPDRRAFPVHHSSFM